MPVNGAAMVARIRTLQKELGMSDGELLKLARLVCGCARLRCIDDLLACETLELLEDLERMASIHHAADMLVAV